MTREDARALEERLRALPRVLDARLPSGPGAGWVPFFPRGHTAWAEMLPSIEAVREKSELTPVLLFAAAEGALHKADCERLGLGYVVTEPIANQDRGHFPLLDRWIESDRIAHGLPLAIFRKRRVKASLARDRIFFHSLLETIDPVILAVSGDRELGAVMPLLGAARDLGIGSILINSIMPSIEADSKARAGKPRFRTQGSAPFHNRRVARTMPEQVAETPYGPLLFSAGWLIEAFAEAGVWPRNPWMNGGGASTWVLSSGPWQADIFRRFGCPEPDERIKVFGLVHADPLYESWSRRDALRRELIERHGLDPAKPLVVLSLPTFYEQRALDWEEHVRQLEAHLEVLARAGVAVLCSLHPKQDPAPYREICARHGFAIEERRLFGYLPAADLFVSAGSSTLDWAVLCGVPAVNLDYIDLDTTLWEAFPGVVEARGAAAFEALLTRFLTDKAWREELTRLQWEGSRRLGLFDGRCGQRLVDFMLEVRARRPHLSGQLKDEGAAAYGKERA